MCSAPSAAPDETTGGQMPVPPEGTLFAPSFNVTLDDGTTTTVAMSLVHRVGACCHVLGLDARWSPEMVVAVRLAYEASTDLPLEGDDQQSRQSSLEELL